MLDINLLRNHFEDAKKRLETRGKKYPILDKFIQIDKEWRNVVTKIQTLNTKRNLLSDQIGKKLSQKKIDESNKIKKEVQELKVQIETLQINERWLSEELSKILYALPNIPDKDVPIGKDENDNVEIRRWGKITKLGFKPLHHYEIAENLQLVDFVRATKLAGSRHTIFIGLGAKLMRVLRDFTVNEHVNAGYVELLPPVLINSNILYGTGHLPKSKEDMFETNVGQFLSPTEEVPLTGYYNGEIIDEKKLPIWLTSSTISFRSEAGSAGKDIRGVIRQHQFYNTEMVMLSKPEESMEMLEKMTNECEKILQALEIPYRVIILSTGDMGNAAAKTYDVEVWFPSENKYREISSCSNCNDYQARGSMIRYRNAQTKKTEYVHTLNGTGTSINRLWAALIENYQQKDGSIKIPLILRKYFNDQEFIK